MNGGGGAANGSGRRRGGANLRGAAAMRAFMRRSLHGVIAVVGRLSPGGAERGDRAAAPSSPWTGALVWFMRTLAWVWLVKGLFNWALVLGALPRYGDFSALPRSLQGSIVFFAAVDPLAAVGLWLATPWGGALWLVCAAIEAASPAFGARGAPTGAPGVALDLLLVALYFFFSWRAGEERL